MFDVLCASYMAWQTQQSHLKFLSSCLKSCPLAVMP